MTSVVKCFFFVVVAFFPLFGRQHKRECARLNPFFLWDGEPMPDWTKRFKLIRFGPGGPRPYLGGGRRVYLFIKGAGLKGVRKGSARGLYGSARGLYGSERSLRVGAPYDL